VSIHNQRLSTTREEFELYHDLSGDNRLSTVHTPAESPPGSRELLDDPTRLEQPGLALSY
jgi:hypothetical protein